jgi:two-component system sensor histidine kinase BaeS
VVSLNEEAKRLSGLIEDLHFLAMSDLSGQPCHFAPGDAVALCLKAVARFGAMATAAGHELTFAADSIGELPVHWDEGRIEQLLANLLTNALRYTDAPGQVRLKLKNHGEHVELTVEDSAPGVPPEHFDQLFVPLYRLDAARSRVSGGSGLGLAVSEAIVRAHGGNISAEPSPLGGVTIRINLPREAEA